MNDTIRRNDALKLFTRETTGKYWGIINNDLLFDIWCDIKNLPSAEPNKWIPCSERLPEERDWYLGIFKEPDTEWINPLPFICDYLLGTKTKATTKEGWILKGFTDREECVDYYFNLECVAWQPLPESYEE